MRAEFPPVEDVLPHEGRVVLLSEILEHDLQHTVCAVKLETPTLFGDPGGDVPAWVGIEYMAQCVAVHAGLLDRADGVRPRPGYLVGSRRIDLHTDRFHLGQVLEVRAVRTWGGREGMVSFDCRVTESGSSALLAAGRLSCFLPPKQRPEQAATRALAQGRA